MNAGKTEVLKSGIAFEYEWNEPLGKVWRAISIAEFREYWLPKDTLADPEAVSVTPDREVCYRIRDNTPPFLESIVTFRIAPTTTGGTSLRIIKAVGLWKPLYVAGSGATSPGGSGQRPQRPSLKTVGIRCAGRSVTT